jgi:phage baseplate assembly protein W
MINDPFQISPLDLDRNSSIGIAFPLLEGGSFIQTRTVNEQVKANIINVLLTNPGERVNQPDLGVGLKNLLFENVTNANEIVPIIEEQLERYVPDIELDDVISEFIDDQQVLQITLVYSLIDLQTRDSILINIGNDTNQGISYRNSAGGFVEGTDHPPHNINNNY